MYTAFGKYPGDWLAIPKAVKYWMGQHAIARIPGPWYYYFPQLAYYETAILLAAVFAFPLAGLAARSVPALAPGWPRCRRSSSTWWRARFVPARAAARLSGSSRSRRSRWSWTLRRRRVRARPLTPFLRFLVFWAVGSLAIYGWAREKVPWLTVHPLLPLTILAAIGLARISGATARQTLRASALAVVASCSPSTRAGCTSPASATARTTSREEPRPRRDARLRPDVGGSRPRAGRASTGRKAARRPRDRPSSPSPARRPGR